MTYDGQGEAAGRKCVACGGNGKAFGISDVFRCTPCGGTGIRTEPFSGEMTGRLVTRDDAAEALRVLRLREERAPHSEAAMQTIVTLCDRVAELEDALVNQHSGTDAVWNEKHELAKRISELEAANARLTAERDRLREAVSSAIDVFDEMDAVAWNDDSDWSQSSYDEAAELVRSALEDEP